jgi:hypothetical protein
MPAAKAPHSPKKFTVAIVGIVNEHGCHGATKLLFSQSLMALVVVTDGFSPIAKQHHRAVVSPTTIAKEALHVLVVCFFSRFSMLGSLWCRRAGMTGSIITKTTSAA